MKYMKKPVALVLALLMALSVLLSACGDTPTNTVVATTAATATTARATTAATATTAAPATTAVATTAVATTAAVTTAANATTAATGTTAATATTAAPATTSATVSGDSVTVSVAGQNVTIKAGGGQTYKPANRVTVRIWSSQVKQNGTAFRALMDKFEQANPNIKVEVDNFNDTATYASILEKLLASAATDSLPNIATGYENWVPAFVQNGKALGLNKFISGQYGLSAQQLADYRPQFLARGIFPQYNNETYLWMFSNSGPVMYYNEDLMKEYGIAKVPETWDEFAAAGKAAAEKSAGKAYGLIFNPRTVSEVVAGIYSRGGKVYDYAARKMVLTEKPAVDHLEMLYNGVKEGWIATADPNVRFDDQNRFIKGEALFYISSTSSRSFIATEQAKEGAKKFNWNAAVIPHAAGVKPVTTLYGGASVSFKGKSEEEDLATWEVLKFMGSANFQAEWASSSGYVPATKSTVDNPVYKSFLDKAPQNKIPLVVYEYATASEPKIGEWEQIRKLVDDNIFALFQNPNGKAADTLKKIEDDANKLLVK